jgi:hypothetical protein
LPVVQCPTTLQDGQLPAFIPQYLPAPAAYGADIAFYSNGFDTILGPPGWTCAGSIGVSGGRSLAVFPPGSANPLTVVDGEATGVAVISDWVGHGPGDDLVCAYFPQSPVRARALDMGTSCALPPGQTTSNVTPDIVRYEGAHEVGLVIFPQGPAEFEIVDVTRISCTLDDGQCDEVLADAAARYAPHFIPVAEPPAEDGLGYPDSEGL